MNQESSKFKRILKIACKISYVLTIALSDHGSLLDLLVLFRFKFVIERSAHL